MHAGERMEATRDATPVTGVSGRPWGMGLFQAAGGYVVAVFCWARGIAGYVLCVVGLAAMATGLHSLLWGRRSRLPQGLRVALSALAALAIFWAVSVVIGAAVDV